MRVFIISDRRVAEFLYTRLNMAGAVVTSDETLSQIHEHLHETFY